MGSPDGFIGCQSLSIFFTSFSWSFSHDLYSSKRTAQNFRTFAAASIPVVLNLTWQGKLWPQKAELALVTHPFQAVLAEWIWESEAYLTRGNLLLCRHNIPIQICSSCLLVLGSSALQLFLLHFILPCRRQLSECHLLPDTCWNETCCPSTDPACLEARIQSGKQASRHIIKKEVENYLNMSLSRGEL